jgi:hypothetical protein
MTRRMTSRRVGLTAAFLTLAAGGTAACDLSTGEDPYGLGPGSYPVPVYDGGDDEPTYAPAPTPSRTSPTVRRTKPTRPPSRPPSPPSPDDVFYCADADGYVVEEYHCDDEDESYDTSAYFLWHSTRYGYAFTPGDLLLRGGSRIGLDDSRARTRAGLPATGFVGNGSVKTNVVGRSSSGDSSSGGSYGDGFSSGG